MKYGITFLTISCLFFCTLTKADGWTSPGDYQQISQFIIQPESSVAGVMIKINFDYLPSTCKNKDTFHLDTSSERGEQLFSTLLSAHMAKKKVRLYIAEQDCKIWDSAWVQGVMVE